MNNNLRLIHLAMELKTGSTRLEQWKLGRDTVDERIENLENELGEFENEADQLREILLNSLKPGAELEAEMYGEKYIIKVVAHKVVVYKVM